MDSAAFWHCDAGADGVINVSDVTSTWNKDTLCVSALCIALQSFTLRMLLHSLVHSEFLLWENK